MTPPARSLSPWSVSATPSVPAGYVFFMGRQSNVLNFVPEIDTAWKFLYRSSEMLSWKDRRGGSAVNVVVVGKLGKDNLQLLRSTDTSGINIDGKSVIRRLDCTDYIAIHSGTNHNWKLLPYGGNAWKYR